MLLLLFGIANNLGAFFSFKGFFSELFSRREVVAFEFWLLAFLKYLLLFGNTKRIRFFALMEMQTKYATYRQKRIPIFHRKT